MSFVKPPSPDKVFLKWVSTVSDERLEELFSVKGIPFDRSSVSAAEFVKGVERRMAALFFSRIETGSVAASPKEDDYKGIVKVKFYSFPSGKLHPDLKIDSRIPIFDSIESVECSECNGLGYYECARCEGEGYVRCSECDGSGRVMCEECDGEKEISLPLKVVVDGVETERELTVQCPTCFGSGSVVCPECSGLARVVCGDCKGEGKFPCRKCKGTGVIFTYKISPPPVSGVNTYLFYSKPDVDNAIADEIGSRINEIEAVTVNDCDQLNKRDLKILLGFYNKDVDEKAQKTKKMFRQLEKTADKRGETPQYPIYLFHVLRLDVTTSKGKKFQLFAAGNENKYIIVPFGI